MALPIVASVPPAVVQPQPLPTVLALAALWREVSARPLWAPPRFWRYLQLRWRMRLKQLDAAAVPISAPVGKSSDCSSCLDLCCVGPKSTVLLRLTDIARLMDVGRTDLISHTKPRFTAAALAQAPALRRQVRSRAWQQFPVLRQTRMGACAALSTEGQCGLYPHWPLACARFPYSLHLEDRELFYSQRCQSFWLHPRLKGRVQAMAVAAVAAYNARIQDAVLLAYAPKALADLGLSQHLQIR